jgi:hypothetical protein
MNAILTSIMILLDPINYEVFKDYWEWKQEC